MALFADASHDDFLGLWFIGNGTTEGGGDLVNSNGSTSPSGGSSGGSNSSRSSRSNIRTTTNININRDDTAASSDGGGAAGRGGDPARRAGLVGKVSSIDPTVCEERPHRHRNVDRGLAATLYSYSAT